MIRETVTAYGIGWAVTRAIKWPLILGWPIGSNPDKWSQSTRTTLTVISLCISVPAYLIYKRGTRSQE